MSNQTNFYLRPLTAADLPALLEVYRQCEDFLALGPAPSATPEMVRADMTLTRAEGGLYSGVFVDGALVGVLDVIPAYQGDPHTAFIELLMLAAPYRGQGLGRALVESLANLQGGKLKAAVQVNNPAAVAFWLRMGFRITGPAALQPDGTVTYPLEREDFPLFGPGQGVSG